MAKSPFEGNEFEIHGLDSGMDGVPLETIVELQSKIRNAMDTYNPSELRSTIRDIAEDDGEVEKILQLMDPHQLHLIRTIHGKVEFERTVHNMLLKIRLVARSPASVTAEDLMRSMSPEDKIQSLFRAIVDAREDPQVAYREYREHGHHKELLRVLCKLTQGLSEDQRLDGAPLARNLIRSMCDTEKIQLRHAAIHKNPHAGLIDAVTLAMYDDTQFIVAFLRGAQRFRQEARGLLLALEKDEDDIGLMENAREISLGFLDVVRRMKANADRFPEKCRDFLGKLDDYHQQIAYVYSDSDEDDRARRHPRKENQIPLYKNNLQHTAFLHALTMEIPHAKTPEKKGDLEYDVAGAKSFAELLRSQADAHLLHSVTTPAFFRSLSSVIALLHVVHAAFSEQYERANIDEVVIQGPDGARQAFAAQINSTMERDSLVSMDNAKRFDPKEVIEVLAEIDMSKVPDDEDGEWQPHEASTDEAKRMLELFGTLDELLVKLSLERGTVDWFALQEDIEGLMRLKNGTQKRSRSRRKRLREDRQEGNFTYRVESGGPYSDLKLYQVATEPAAWEDIIGSSWRDAKEKLDTVYGHARRANIFTELAPRRQVNTNMLLIGPPGSGKNIAVRAMMADPRTVGVATTVAELMSEFVGRAERNIVDLFDAAHDLRTEHDKPVVVSIDEFDTMFPNRAGGVLDHVKRDMQKAFQSVLDGHIRRDGVLVVAMTNNPEHIDAAVLRRFAHIEIIQKLRRDERMTLLRQLLRGIPLENDFEKSVHWDRLIEASEDASGDTIGKIADAAYLEFIRLFDAKRPGRLDRIHERIDALSGSGHKRLTVEKKLSLFGAGKGKNIVLSADAFESIAMQVLESDDTVSDMRAQDRFYETVRRKLDEGFMGRPL